MDPTPSLYPPRYTKLYDAWVFVLIHICTPAQRTTFWPADFTSDGSIRQFRLPTSPKVWILRNMVPYHPVYRSATTRARRKHYVLCGTQAAQLGAFVSSSDENPPGLSPFTYGTHPVPQQASKLTEVAWTQDLTSETSRTTGMMQWCAEHPSPLISHLRNRTGLRCGRANSNETIFLREQFVGGF